MKSLELIQRATVLAEAESWLRTPFHNGARVKGVGCDCGTLLGEVYTACEIHSVANLPAYRIDWFQHTREEMYLNELAKYAGEVATPEPADIALFKWGRVYAHAAIVVEWPHKIIHARTPTGVELADASKDKLSSLPVKFFSPWASPGPLTT